MLRAHPFDEVLSDELIVNLEWWRNALSSVLTRVATLRPRFPKFIIYTDASWSDKRNQGRIAELLFDRSSGALLEVLSLQQLLLA